MKSYFEIFLSGFLLIGLAGCVGTPNLPAQPEYGESQEPTALVPSYKMAVADVVQINVWKNPELSVSEPIRPDGKISMPLIGDVMAVGRTPEELSAAIEERLSDYLKSSNVTVILTSLEGQAFLSRIRVTGSVGQDISMSYQQGMTVLDAVLEAGSVDEFADSNRTRLHRRTSAGSESYDIRLEDIMQDGDMTSNILLLPGDIITVPERRY